jgi:hypothetical protein
MEIHNKYIKNLLSNFVLSNLPIIIALILLTSAPFLLLLHKEDIANQNAGYAFYFLIAGVLWKIIQYFMDKNRHEKNFCTKKLESEN